MIQNGNGAAEPAFNAEVIDLDAFCKARSITSIGLLKIDVEGAEVEVLRRSAGRASGTKTLMIECHAPLATSVRHFLASTISKHVKRVPLEGASVLHFARPRKTALSATDGIRESRGDNDRSRVPRQ